MTAAIELYRHEKALYEARRKPVVDAALEQVRAAIARFEDANPMAKARAKGRQARVNARNTERAAAKTHFKCGHPRSPENTKYHSPRKGVSGRLAPMPECKTCITERNKRRERSKKDGPSSAQRDRRVYDRQLYADNREKKRAQAREAYRRRTQLQEPANV